MLSFGLVIHDNFGPISTFLVLKFIFCESWWIGTAARSRNHSWHASITMLSTWCWHTAILAQNSSPPALSLTRSTTFRSTKLMSFDFLLLCCFFIFVVLFYSFSCVLFTKHFFVSLFFFTNVLFACIWSSLVGFLVSQCLALSRRTVSVAFACTHTIMLFLLSRLRVSKVHPQHAHCHALNWSCQQPFIRLRILWHHGGRAESVNTDWTMVQIGAILAKVVQNNQLLMESIA